MKLTGALCAKLPPQRALNLFFNENNAEEAKAMCRRCPVIVECESGSRGEPDGIWAATDAEMRRRRWRSRERR